MYLLYSTVSVLFVLAVSPYFVYQAVRYRKYIGSLGQRLGYLPVSFNLDGERSIWIHAVSVGEALTARAIIEQLRERYPRLRIYLSTTTMTGQQVARSQLRHMMKHKLKYLGQETIHILGFRYISHRHHRLRRQIHKRYRQC